MSNALAFATMACLSLNFVCTTIRLIAAAVIIAPIVNNRHGKFIYSAILGESDEKAKGKGYGGWRPEPELKKTKLQKFRAMELLSKLWEPAPSPAANMTHMTRITAVVGDITRQSD